jgi:hypothetical protein
MAHGRGLQPFTIYILIGTYKGVVPMARGRGHYPFTSYLLNRVPKKGHTHQKYIPHISKMMVTHLHLVSILRFVFQQMDNTKRRKLHNPNEKKTTQTHSK